MHLRVVTVTALSFAVGMLFCSCGIQSEIFVNGEGAGEVEFRIEFSEFLLETELMEPLPTTMSPSESVAQMAELV